MADTPTLPDLITDWIAQNFDSKQVIVEDCEIKFPSSKRSAIIGKECRIICGRITSTYVRLRGRRYFPAMPDFLDRLKAEIEDTIRDPDDDDKWDHWGT